MDKDVYCQQLIVNAKIHTIHSTIVVYCITKTLLEGSLSISIGFDS